MVAVVTGGGRGIGRAEALELAARGASVVVNDLGAGPGGEAPDDDPASAVVAEIATGGGAAVANHADIASMDGARGLVEQAIDTYGRLDILVNNAGILRDRMIFNMSEEEWDAVMRVHLKGHFAPTRFATEYWRAEAKAGRPVAGRIICTSSSSGLFGNAGQANYASAKAGIAAFAVVVAREMAKYGVTCNAICPVARTRLMAQAFEAHGRDAGSPGEAGSDALDPANVAALVAHLVHPDAAHVSGQVFVVGGGRVQLADGWAVASGFHHDGPLTETRLAAEMPHLFAGRSTQPRPFEEAAAQPSEPA